MEIGEKRTTAENGEGHTVQIECQAREIAAEVAALTPDCKPCARQYEHGDSKEWHYVKEERNMHEIVRKPTEKIRMGSIDAGRTLIVPALTCCKESEIM